MPLMRCKPDKKGGMIVLFGRPYDIKPGWKGYVPQHLLNVYPFLEKIVVKNEVVIEDEEPIIIME